MIEKLPLYISIVFGLTTLATLTLFYYALKRSQIGISKTNIILASLTVWLIIQAILTLNNFYNSDTRSLPPKFLLLVIPPLLTLLFLFITENGRKFMDALSLRHLTYVHVVRVPVELVLYWLFLNKAVPELMTFAGRNFDILAGITAPLVAYYGFDRQGLKRKTLLIWNILALGLVLNIVIHAVLSAPFPIQQLAFDQPNIAVLYFPFSWLPGFIVPLVLFGHLVSIRRLIRSNRTK